MFKLAVDPGHGGRDPGAVAGGLQEKDITLDIAKRLGAELTGQASILLTRTEDAELGPTEKSDLWGRCHKANSWGADFFLSIHCNAFTDPAAHGVETWVVQGAYPSTRQTASIIQQKLSALGFADRGVKEDGNEPKYILRQTTMSAALVETGFLTNPEDRAKLAQPEFRQRIAEALADAIREAFNLQPTWPEIAAKEIQKLRDDGVLVNDRAWNDGVKWGELAAVLNRMRGRG